MFSARATAVAERMRSAYSFLSELGQSGDSSDDDREQVRENGAARAASGRAGGGGAGGPRLHTSRCARY